MLSESKDYNIFKDYDINKSILTLSQMNNIKRNSELYQKYNYFLSLKKKQDKIQFETLLPNILLIFRNISKNKFIYTDIKVNSLFKNFDFTEFEYKSTEKTAYFDLFISFISMYTSDYESFVESSSMVDTTKLVIPMHALAYIFSSQLFFCDMARLMQIYYDKFLSYKIIPIYIKGNEIFLSKINMRHLIWKMFEIIFLFYKIIIKLYIKNSVGDYKLDEKKCNDFSEQTCDNIRQVFNINGEIIAKKHRNINIYNLYDKRITLTDKENSVPSSLYNQTNENLIDKLKLNLFKYKQKQRGIAKTCKLNDGCIRKSQFFNTVKDKIFQQSTHYINPYDTVQDFLDNYF